MIGVLFKDLIGFIKCSYGIGRFWENCHHRIADGFYNSTTLLNNGLLQYIEMVHYHPDCRFISIFTVQIGGVVEVGKQDGQIFSVQLLFIPNKFFREKIPEELPGGNFSCRNGEFFFVYVFTPYNHHIICLVVNDQIGCCGKVEPIRHRPAFPKVNGGVAKTAFINLSLYNFVTFI